MERKENGMKSEKVMTKATVLYDTMIGIQERAAKEGRKFNSSALLGYVYKNAAGQDANPEVLKTLGADYFDHSSINQKELDTFIRMGSELVDFVAKSGSNSLQHIATIPDELAELVMHHLMFLEDSKETIYLPYAGIASFADQCKEATFVGEEQNEEIWAIAQVRAFFRHSKVNISLGDSLHAKEKYNTIVALPPFGLRGELSMPSIIESLFNRLLDGGRMALVVPASFLSETGVQASRVKKMLLEEHALERVVLLPANLLANTSMSTAILLIQKADIEHPKYSITLTDYASFIKDNRKYGSMCKLDMEAIHDAEVTYWANELMGRERKEPFRIEVDSRDLIVSGNYDISPKYYITRAKIEDQKTESTKLVPLYDLVDVYGKANLSYEKLRVVHIQDLADTILMGAKDFLNLEAEEGKAKALPLLMEDNLLLIGLVGKTLKPTIFKLTEGYRVAYSENIVPLKLKSNLVTLEYLQCELASDSVLEQLEAYYAGAARPFVNRSNLLNILIRVPNLEEEQKRIVKERKDALSAELIQKLGLENEELRNTRHNEFVREMRVRKHAIGQVLNELDPAIDTLLRFEKKNNGVLRGSDIISERFNYSVDDYLQRVRFLVSKVMTMVNTLTNEYVPKGVIKEYNVVDMLEEYFRKHTIPEGYEVSIKHEVFTSDLHIPEGILLPDGSVTEKLDINAGDNMDFWSIEVCKEDFFQVLDNIISNAKRYGFTENRPDYCIRIEMEDVRDEKQPMVAIHIMNNGNPLPEGIQPEQVFAYGEGSAQGTGIGGWQIKQIVEGMGGKVELRPLNPEESNYTIDYVLTFPDKSVLVLDNKEE